MSQTEFELATVLARFKLKVRRDLNHSIDLTTMSVDRAYADRVLKEVEELAEDEDLLVMVIRLRHLFAQASAESEPAAKSAATRSYQFGARSW